MIYYSTIARGMPLLSINRPASLFTRRAEADKSRDSEGEGTWNSTVKMSLSLAAQKS